MSVDYLQRELQSIYELNVSHDVSDFLIKEDLTEQLSARQKNTLIKEKLLLVQEKDDLNIGLYLHNDVLNTIKRDSPEHKLHAGNLEAFCLALEGVSHFLYLIWNAGFDRSITLLELELQAEIDKFVMLAFSLEEQNQSVSPGQLRRLLFETAAYHDSLNEGEKQRYLEASAYAEKYCWKLESDYLSQKSRQQTLSELRQFYRLSCPEKLRRIQQLH